MVGDIGADEGNVERKREVEMMRKRKTKERKAIEGEELEVREIRT
jgi:hypothetical protein